MSVTLNPAAHTRIVPAVVFDIKRPQRMVERSIMVARRSWMVLLSGFFEPFFYLLSIRIGLSALVGDVEVGVTRCDNFVARLLHRQNQISAQLASSTSNENLHYFFAFSGSHHQRLSRYQFTVASSASSKDRVRFQPSFEIFEMSTE